MTANEYCVTVKRENGQEVILRQFAYNPLDAWQQALVSALATWPDEQFKVTAVGPPPEAYAKSDFQHLLDRLAGGVGKKGQAE